MNGKELFNKELTELQTKIDMSGLDSGMYIIRLMQDDQIELRKVVKF
jgi:hypothetical protein